MTEEIHLGETRLLQIHEDQSGVAHRIASRMGSEEKGKLRETRRVIGKNEVIKRWLGLGIQVEYDPRVPPPAMVFTDPLKR